MVDGELGTSVWLFVDGARSVRGGINANEAYHRLEVNKRSKNRSSVSEKDHASQSNYRRGKLRIH